MGQYYKPVILTDDNKPEIYASSWDFQNGAKLMEHSYIGNTLVGAVEYMIEDDEAKIVWAGDYADGEQDNEENNIYDIVDNEDNNVMKITPQYFAKEKKKGVDYICAMFQRTSKRTRYIINHTKKQFVDKTKCPVSNDEWKLSINPLPLLTAEGNGRGGGDYNGVNCNLVGSWARNLISVSVNHPGDDYEEIIPNFMEYHCDWVVNGEVVTPKKKREKIKVKKANLVV